MLWRALLGATIALLASSNPQAKDCDLAIVGAGWGGVYTAWRLAVDSGPSRGGVDASGLCVFEAYGRPGGRTYDIHLDGYVVDVGAYRFAGDMHLPADLISGALRLPSVCYDPTCNDTDVRGEVQWPYREPLRKIVDFEGRSVGYAAAVKAMLGQLRSAGARFHFSHQLVGLTQELQGYHLHFGTGTSVRVNTVVLNMPRGALVRVAGLEAIMGPRWAALTCTERSFPPHITEGRATVKVYAVYEEAWWVSRLRLLHGAAEELDTDPPVAIHYHDGEVLCKDGEDLGGRERWLPARQVSEKDNCKGVLQVFYRHSQLCPASNPGCMDFWAERHRTNESNPLTLLKGSDPLLQDVHRKLLTMHEPIFQKLNASSQGILPPSALAFSVWTRTGMLPPGDDGLQVSVEDVVFHEQLPATCGVQSVREYQDLIQGTGPAASMGSRIHVVNNDFTAGSSATWHGPWAEMSLLGAERVLRGSFNLSRPAWLNESYYAKEVAMKVAAGVSPQDPWLGEQVVV